jgi:hypothetical protein
MSIDKCRFARMSLGALPEGPRDLDPALVRCAACRTKIVVPDADGLVVKNAILRVSRTGHATAKCPRCKAWVEVPLRYHHH